MIKKVIKSIVLLGADVVAVKSKIKVKEARDILQKYSSKPIGECFANNIIDTQYDLQIIIPAYNVEKYIKECIQSVTSQNLKYSILITIVNDGSTDETDSIVKSYPEVIGEHIRINVIEQINKGLSSARNSAIKIIKGKYITFLDSDDVLSQNAINDMLDIAYEKDVDILQGGWYTFSYDNRGKYIIDEKVGNNNISGFPWGKLYKYSVLEHFQFPEGYWFEDTPISFILAAMDWHCVTVKNIVYGYQQNPNGITATSVYRKKSVDSYWITEQCLEEFPKFGLEYNQQAYEYFLRQSIMNEGRIIKQPRQVREAVFILTADLMEHYFKEFTTENLSMKKIESALRKKQFIKFELLFRCR